MIKRKEIINKSKSRHNYKQKYNRQKNNYENLPFFEGIRDNHIKRGYWSYSSNNIFINWFFITNFLKSKVGENWDDVYSELLKKTENKYHWVLNRDLDRYVITKELIFINNIPYLLYGFTYRPGRRFLYDVLFIDENNIISYYETKEDLINEYKMRILRKKLERILKDI